MSHPLRDKASEAYAKGKFAKAAELYQEYCEKEPKDHQSRVRLGDAWARAGKSGQAIGAYKLAAEGFAREGFLPRAIAASKLILELDPKHAQIQQLLADLYAKRKGPPTQPMMPAVTAPAPFKPTRAPIPLDDEVEEEPIALIPRAAPEPPHAIALDPDPFILEEPSATPSPPRFDELELDVEAAAQALWGGPGQSASAEVDGDSLLHAVERAAEQAALQVEPEPAPEPEPEGHLPQIPLFSDLDHDAFIALFQRCPLRRVGAGERIIVQGARGDSFYVVCAGAVRVLRAENGQERVLAQLGEGAFFGEMALLSGAPRAASVEGLAEETQLLEISVTVLSELAKPFPGVVRALRRFCRQRMLTNVMETAPLFTAFNRKERKDLAERFRAREVSAGEPLVREGTPSDGLYVVLSGEVEIRRGGAARAVLREGEIFGELSLLNRAPAESSVFARRRTSLLRLPRPDFDALILTHPQILVMISELTEARRAQGSAV